MSNLNLVALQGNLVADPQSFDTKSGDGIVVRFTLAVNSGFGEKRSASFVDCVSFGKQAEIVKKYLAKGRQVIVNGELRQASWEKDGQKRSKLEVYLNSINGFFFVGNKPQTETDSVETEVETAAAPAQEQLF